MFSVSGFATFLVERGFRVLGLCGLGFWDLSFEGLGFRDAVKALEGPGRGDKCCLDMFYQ